MKSWQRPQAFFTRRLPARIDFFAIRLAVRRFRIRWFLPNAATDELARQAIFVGNLALHVTPRSLHNLPQRPENLRKTLLDAAAMRPKRTYRLPEGMPLIDAKVGNAQLSVTQRSVKCPQERPA